MSRGPTYASQAQFMDCSAELRQAIAFRKDGSYLPCCAKSDFSSLCGTWAYCSSGPPQRGHCGIDAMSSQDENVETLSAKPDRLVFAF